MENRKGELVPFKGGIVIRLQERITEAQVFDLAKRRIAPDRVGEQLELFPKEAPNKRECCARP
jgi:hypothetical protein